MGRYRAKFGQTEGKYFFKSPEQPSNYARMIGDKPYTTTSVKVSPEELAKGYPIDPGTEGEGYFFGTEDIPSGPVTIFDRSIIP